MWITVIGQQRECADGHDLRCIVQTTRESRRASRKPVSGGQGESHAAGPGEATLGTGAARYRHLGQYQTAGEGADVAAAHDRWGRACNVEHTHSARPKRTQLRLADA